MNLIYSDILKLSAITSCYNYKRVVTGSFKIYMKIIYSSVPIKLVTSFPIKLVTSYTDDINSS